MTKEEEESAKALSETTFKKISIENINGMFFLDRLSSDLRLQLFKY